MLRPWGSVCLALLASGIVRAEDEPVRAVLAGKHFVQPLTGEDLGWVQGASSYDAAAPLPGLAGRFRIGDLLVDAATRRVTGTVKEEISFEDKSVLRRDPAGRVIWSHALTGTPGGVRPPDHVAIENRVFVVVGNAVVALDRATGEEKWRAEGEHDRLLASGTLLLATSCGYSTDPKFVRCLVARETQTGTEVFRVRLPDKGDPGPIREAGDFLVVSDEGFGASEPGWARCVDRTGKLRLELAECPALIWPAGDDLLVATSSRTARFDPQGKTLWETKEFRAGDPDGAGFAALPGGDFVVFAWSPISDSGVNVVRVNPSDGTVVWKVHCAGLGVGHSKYWHRCYVEVRGDALVVVSQAAGGHFVEALETATGKSLKRTLVK